MTATLEDVPIDVREMADDVNQAESCAVCGDTLYGIEHPEDGLVWVDSNGTIRGDSAGIGAVYVGDEYSEPHNLDPDGSETLCGYCADIDSFEQRGSFLIGVLPRNQSYNSDTGVLIQDTVVETHYLYRDGTDYRDTPFKQTIKDYALEQGDNNGNLRIGEWFDSEERYYGNNWLESVPLHEHAHRRHADPSIRKFTKAVTEHDVELEYPALVSGSKIWVPSQHVEDTINAFEKFKE